MKILIPTKTDIELRTVALKSRKDGRVVVKEVVRASVNSGKIFIRDIAYGMMAGYVVDWSPEGLGMKKYWSYEGKWAAEPYCLTRNQWKLGCPTLNPEVIAEHPRFKYSAYRSECGNPIDYLKRYVENPKLELMSKLGLGRLAECKGFVTRLEKNKKLMRFLLDRKEEITPQVCGVNIINLAFKRGVSLNEARRLIDNQREFSKRGLPYGVDVEKARSYVDRTMIRVEDYCLYLGNCQQLGLNLADTKVAFPINYQERATVIEDEVMEQERRRSKALTRKQDRKIRELVKQFKCVAKYRNDGLLIKLPTKTWDLRVEGKALKNCLGDGHYAAKMARGETLIAFIRYAGDPDRPAVAVEYDIRQKRILQCYGVNNNRPPAFVERFVNEAFMIPAA